MVQPFAPWTNAPVRSVRRGHLWISDERVTLDGRTYQGGPMFVEWEASECVTRPWLVLDPHRVREPPWLTRR